VACYAFEWPISASTPRVVLPVFRARVASVELRSVLIWEQPARANEKPDQVSLVGQHTQELDLPL